MNPHPRQQLSVNEESDGKSLAGGGVIFMQASGLAYDELGNSVLKTERAWSQTASDL